MARSLLSPAAAPAQGGGTVHRIIRNSAFTLLAAASLAAVSPGRALAGHYGCKLWAATSYIAPLSESDRNIGGVTAAVKGSNEMGYEFGAEFRSKSLGFAFDYLNSRQELQHASAGFLGSAEFKPISASLLLYLPLPVLEMSLGATASYVNWGDLQLSNGTTQPMNAKLGYGITVAGDYPLGKAFAVTGGMRWLKLQAEPEGGSSIKVDPLISHVGLALRF
jgi:hypothetical protein